MSTIMINGRVTQDLELKETANGGTYVRFSIVENIQQKIEGEYQSVPIFYGVIAFDKLAENLVKAKVKKGSGLSITGRPDAQAYKDKEGNLKSSINVTVYDWNYLPTAVSKKADTDADTTNTETENEEVYYDGDSDMLF